MSTQNEEESDEGNDGSEDQEIPKIRSLREALLAVKDIQMLNTKFPNTNNKEIASVVSRQFSGVKDRDGVCGSNDHPDSILFIQMFRLRSTYTLVKPPKGSNVSGGNMINILLNIKDITNINEQAQRIKQKLDDILDKGHSEKIESTSYS
ncbi:hypothetical protein QTP88_026567 [Uroleucon formosanum]